MTLQIPNQIHAAAQVLLELDAGLLMQATMQNSTGFSALRVEQAEGALIFTLVSELSRFEGFAIGGASTSALVQSFIGPPMDPLGIAALDALEPDEVWLSFVPDFQPMAEGSQIRFWCQVFRLPLLGV